MDNNPLRLREIILESHATSEDNEYLEKVPRKKLMLIGHRAAYYALEHRYHAIPIDAIANAPWKWQPGWHYKIQ